MLEILLYLKTCNQILYLIYINLISYSTVASTNPPASDPSQDLIMDYTNCIKTPLEVTYTYYRKLNTGDTNDKVIEANMCYDIVWAIGHDFTWAKH